MIRALELPAALNLAANGQATMAESPAVEALAREYLTRGGRCVRIDLRDCAAIDSTFSGTLLSLQRQLEKVGGDLVLVSPSPKVLDLLAQMGLEDFYEVEVVAPALGAWTELPAPPTGTRAQELRRIIIEAHEELARTAGATGREFQTVVEELRREERERAGDAST